MSERPPATDAGRLRERHQQTQTLLKKLSLVGRGLTILLIVVFAVSLTSLYGKLTTMYAPENFAEPLRAEAEKLLPRVESELITLWEETAPVYGDLALQKFEEAIPELREAGQREMENFLANLSGSAEEQINAALTRVYRKHRSRVESEFPQLSTEEGAEEWGGRWMEAVEADFEDVILHFNALYTRDLEQLVMTLEEFHSNEFEHLDEEQLFRQFLHLWLMKVDRLVLPEEEGIEPHTEVSHAG